MKYKNREIGESATIEQIQDYIALKRMRISAEDVYNYWNGKKWLTQKGKGVATLEAAVNVYNGIAVARARKEKEKSIRQIYRNTHSDKTPSVRYAEQLQMKQWKAFRAFIFEARGKECEICGSRKNLQIHHPKYIPGRLAWGYLYTEVEVVCGECHKAIHHKK